VDDSTTGRSLSFENQYTIHKTMLSTQIIGGVATARPTSLISFFIVMCEAMSHEARLVICFLSKANVPIHSSLTSPCFSSPSNFPLPMLCTVSDLGYVPYYAPKHALHCGYGLRQLRIRTYKSNYLDETELPANDQIISISNKGLYMILRRNTDGPEFGLVILNFPRTVGCPLDVSRVPSL
jgi:hypothetical protein